MVDSEKIWELPFNNQYTYKGRYFHNAFFYFFFSMKAFFIFVFSIALLTNCSAQNHNDSLSINYNAATRGSSILIIVATSKVIYTSNTENKEIALSEIQWNKIKELTSKIELETISNLEAPSNKRYTDRALIGSLTITKDDEIYESSTFDHGNPPIELKKLIDSLFEIVH